MGANHAGAPDAFMARDMAMEALVSRPGSSWSTAPPSHSAAHATAVHRGGPSAAAAPSPRGEAARASTAYSRAAPGAPVSRLDEPPARPPRPSPRYQTSNAQATEAASAGRAVRG
jgi:hypothetical protein